MVIFSIPIVPLGNVVLPPSAQFFTVLRRVNYAMPSVCYELGPCNVTRRSPVHCTAPRNVRAPAFGLLQ